MKKKLTFIIAFLCFSNLCPKSSDLIDSFYKEDPWGFVGKKFYDNPLKTYNKAWKKVTRFFTGAAGLYGGGLLGKRALAKRSDFLSFVGMLVGAGSGLVFPYGILNSQMKRRADHKALKDFVHKWEKYKKLTPKALHEVFDRMYVLYSDGGWDEISGDTQEIIKEVRKSLANNDPRYAELYKTNGDFFDAKYFVMAVDINVADLLRVFWDIFKAFNENDKKKQGVR
jgi:hypothetical protein